MINDMNETIKSRKISFDDFISINKSEGIRREGDGFSFKCCP